MITANSSPFTRHHNVSVTNNRLTVEDVLAFADKLRKSGAPLREQISDDHSHETRHLTGLRVQWTEELEVAGRA